jgi:hypothetical protein
LITEIGSQPAGKSAKAEKLRKREAIYRGNN